MSQSTGVTSQTSTTGAAAYNSRSGSGQFRLNDYDLDLQFDNGTHTSQRIIAPTGDIDMLVIGETVYMRKDMR